MTATFPKPDDDEKRLAFLADLAILDTAPDENLDRVVALCSGIFGVPVALVSLVDEERQWFKSIEGLDVCETSRDVAFCNYTILADEIFEVVDAVADPRFAGNALVTDEPHIRYYAGAPLVYDGVRLGSLCLIDFVPRDPLTPQQRELLHSLAELVIREIRVQRLLRVAVASLADSARDAGAHASNS
jgi:GAF domain-containing protein